MRRLLTPQNVNDCDCGCGYCSKETDGLCETFYCFDCGDLLASLVVNTET